MDTRRLIADALRLRLRRGRGGVAYGPARGQRADLYLPPGVEPVPVAVLLHGGYWRAHRTKLVMSSLVLDLLRRGTAVLNVEYRRLGWGSGGGYPGTFQDVADAVDALAAMGGGRVDLDRVSLVGHSAGGHLALWAAARARRAPGEPGADPTVSPRACVALAAVCDLAAAATEGGPVQELLGGAPAHLRDRYAVADPMHNLPAPMPVLLVHGTDDDTVPVRRSRDYAAAARAAGGEVELIEIAGPAGAHREPLVADGEMWGAATAWLARRGLIGAMP